MRFVHGMTVRVWAFDVPPPGTGLKTVMLRVPVVVVSLAGISAVSWVELTKVVVRLAPLRRTTELPTKFVPLTVSAKPPLPIVTVAGATVVVVGTGFENVAVIVGLDPEKLKLHGLAVVEVAVWQLVPPTVAFIFIAALHPVKSADPLAVAVRVPVAVLDEKLMPEQVPLTIWSAAVATPAPPHEAGTVIVPWPALRWIVTDPLVPANVRLKLRAATT